MNLEAGLLQEPQAANGGQLFQLPINTEPRPGDTGAGFGLSLV